MVPRIAPLRSVQNNLVTLVIELGAMAHGAWGGCPKSYAENLLLISYPACPRPSDPSAYHGNIVAPHARYCSILARQLLHLVHMGMPTPPRPHSLALGDCGQPKSALYDYGIQGTGPDIQRGMRIVSIKVVEWD